MTDNVLRSIISGPQNLSKPETQDFFFTNSNKTKGPLDDFPQGLEIQDFLQSIKRVPGK